MFGGRSKKKEGKGPKTLVDDNAPCVFKKLRKNQGVGLPRVVCSFHHIRCSFGLQARSLAVLSSSLFPQNRRPLTRPRRSLSYFLHTTLGMCVCVCPCPCPHLLKSIRSDRQHTVGLDILGTYLVFTCLNVVLEFMSVLIVWYL